MDTLHTVRFREVSGLSSFKNFKNQTTGCGAIAYSPVGVFYFEPPCTALLELCSIYVNLNFGITSIGI